MMVKKNKCYVEKEGNKAKRGVSLYLSHPWLTFRVFLREKKGLRKVKRNIVAKNNLSPHAL